MPTFFSLKFLVVWLRARQQALGILLLALIFGSLCVLPALEFHTRSGFGGVELEAYDAEVHYAARVKEAMEGHLALGNVYLPNKNLSYALPIAPEVTVGLMGRLLLLSAVQAVQASQVVLGALVFLAFFRFVGLFVQDRRAAALAVFGVLCASFVVLEPSWLWHVLRGSVPASAGLSFGRPINPAWGAGWTLVALYHLVHWYEEQKMRDLWWLALAFIVLIYSYVYGWTIVAVMVVGIGALSLIRYKRLPWKSLGMVGGAAVVLLLPYLYNLRYLTSNPLYPALTMRFGVLPSHTPIMSITALATGLVFLLLCRGAWARYRSVLLLLVATWFIVLNQQLMTGHVIQVGHYEWYFIQPISFALIAALILDRILAWRRLRSQVVTNTFLFILCFAALLAGVMRQHAFYKTNQADWNTQQVSAGVLGFLKTHAQEQEVVYAPLALSDLIPIYTETNVYQASNMVGYLISTQEFAERYFFDEWIQHGDTYRPDWSDRQQLCALSARLYAVYYGQLTGNCAALPSDEVKYWQSAFLAYQQMTPKIKLTFHRVDYIVLGTNQGEGSWTTYAQKVYQDAFYTIYKVAPLNP